MPLYQKFISQIDRIGELSSKLGGLLNQRYDRRQLWGINATSITLDYSEVENIVRQLRDQLCNHQTVDMRLQRKASKFVEAQRVKHQLERDRILDEVLNEQDTIDLYLKVAFSFTAIKNNLPLWVVGDDNLSVSMQEDRLRRLLQIKIPQYFQPDLLYGLVSKFLSRVPDKLIKELRLRIASLEASKQSHQNFKSSRYAFFDECREHSLQLFQQHNKKRRESESIIKALERSLKQLCIKQLEKEGQADEAFLREIENGAMVIEVAEAVIQKEIQQTSKFTSPRKTSSRISIYRRPIVERGTELDLDSQKLCKQWSNGDNDFDLERMYSARIAELEAVQIYRELFTNVVDLSASQIKNDGNDLWKLADIKVVDRLVDIKNSRRSFSSPNSYSEYCIPRFKESRDGKNVVYSAFLSPYVRREKDENDEPQFLIWLGETDKGCLDKLAKEFSGNSLELVFSLVGKKSALPPWIFDYPGSVYETRNESLKRLRSRQCIWPLGEIDVPDAILAAESSLQLAGEARMLREQFAISGYKRPVLFLWILSRFCECIAKGEMFPVDNIRLCLGNDPENPLGIVDPLATITELVNVLEQIQRKCSHIIKRYKFFQLAGANLFRGRATNGRWETIFAYCGGWKEIANGKNVKCGKTPIYLGQDKVCPQCGKLICSECGFCQKSCPRLETQLRSGERRE